MKYLLHLPSTTVGGLSLLLLGGAATILSRSQECCAFVSTGSVHFKTRSASASANERAYQSSKMPMATMDVDGGDSRDVLIVGGGLAGLSVAYYIATHSNFKVTVLDGEPHPQRRSESTAGSFASAGTLGPQSGYMPKGPLLDIFRESRAMYPEWVSEIEHGAKEASQGEGNKYLPDVTDPWEVGFVTEGGLLGPLLYDGETKEDLFPDFPFPGWDLLGSTQPVWVDGAKARELEPELSEEVSGGMWVEDSPCVNSARLTCSLRAACFGAGVEMYLGEEWKAASLKTDDDNGTKCNGVVLEKGGVLQAKSIVVANGSFVKALLKGEFFPIDPIKGQSLLLKMPEDSPPILSRALIRSRSFIVPTADGHILVGGSFEPSESDGGVNPTALEKIFSAAEKMVPALADLPIEDEYAGLRPTTKDNCPILGKADHAYDNVYVAGGYSCAGVLLTPKAGQLIGKLVVEEGNVNALSGSDKQFLREFSWSRFSEKTNGIEQYAKWFDNDYAREGGAEILFVL